MTLNAAIVKELGGAASVLELCVIRFGAQLAFNLLIYLCWSCGPAEKDTVPPLLRTGQNWALLARAAVGAISIGGSYYAFRYLPLGELLIS